MYFHLLQIVCALKAQMVDQAWFKPWAISCITVSSLLSGVLVNKVCSRRLQYLSVGIDEQSQAFV